jgi:predicted tellurium resistance membrane protein TerC
MELFDPNLLVAFLTLTALEVVLGIDNIIFISILAGRLPPSQRALARQVGLSLAVITRIGLLFMLSWIIGLTAPLFTVFAHAFSGRDLILAAGGAFLVAKATSEIHYKLEGAEGGDKARVQATFAGVIVQILLLDIVFSLDSVITAVGMVKYIEIMVAAVLVSVAMMLAFAGVIGEFVERHPSVKMLALSFLLLIGTVLLAEGFGHHIPKAYVYLPIAFSVFVEMLNLRLRSRSGPPVRLRDAFETE